MITIGQRRVAEELAKSYMKHPDSWRILCMLINVDSEYKILSEKLRILEKLFNTEKTNSLIFYLEVFRCYREKSTSLKKLGMFEIRVLLFAAKYGLMTKELALYTANLASQSKAYDKHLFQTLVLCYKAYPESMILTSICTLLIKGNCVGKEYFEWYEKAVEEELKSHSFTNLYGISGCRYVSEAIATICIFIFFTIGYCDTFLLPVRAIFYNLYWLRTLQYVCFS